HLILVFYHKHTQFAGPGKTEKNVVGQPFFPVYVAKAGGFFFLVFGVVTVIAAIATVNPVWVYGPYRPDQVSTGAQPDWYLGFAEGLVRVMPGWEIAAGGHTLNLGILIPLVAFPLWLILIGVYPFVEAWITGDRRERHLLDRPRNRPVRTGLGVAWLTGFLVALAAGGNDLWATHFHLSVNAITWFARIALIAGPVLAFVVTKRICLGLQRRDRDKVEHGRETGRIRRLPHGEYVEIHEPLPQGERFRLTAHEQPKALAPPATQDGHGVRRRVGRTVRLRVALSRWMFGEGTQVPKAGTETPAHAPDDLPTRR
ncbi:ubiquinol-cytochrome c reductase cytochrome b subunit, partial [Streptomyces sp. SID5785]|uniref:cytochrome b N-terminal domain-containing protein n=1 Tax=Streptomyces sp. SID5785 TaxID=2690309 RepID=UPI001360E64A